MACGSASLLSCILACIFHHAKSLCWIQTADACMDVVWGVRDQSRDVCLTWSGGWWSLGRWSHCWTEFERYDQRGLRSKQVTSLVCWHSSCMQVLHVHMHSMCSCMLQPTDVAGCVKQTQTSALQMRQDPHIPVTYTYTQNRVELSHNSWLRTRACASRHGPYVFVRILSSVFTVNLHCNFLGLGPNLVWEAFGWPSAWLCTLHWLWHLQHTRFMMIHFCIGKLLENL